MIDRNYDRVIIVCYPQSAGGNFLINCLSLTEQCVLRSADFARQQLKKSFLSTDKLKYFYDQLSLTQQNGQWNDLGLGCYELYGIQNELYLKEYPEVIQNQFNDVVEDLISNKKYLFIVAHNTLYLDAYLKFWHNARVIFLTDYKNFVRKRIALKYTPEIKEYWNNIRATDWPTNLPTGQEFLNLPQKVQQQLLTGPFSAAFKKILMYQKKFELLDQQSNSKRIELGNNCFLWNVDDNYSGNSSLFLDSLHKCAAWAKIDIDVIDSDLVNFYNRWLNVILDQSF